MSFSKKWEMLLYIYIIEFVPSGGQFKLRVCFTLDIQTPPEKVFPINIPKKKTNLRRYDWMSRVTTPSWKVALIQKKLKELVDSDETIYRVTKPWKKARRSTLAFPLVLLGRHRVFFLQKRIGWGRGVFFPTCQVRVVRFYVSCLLLLFLLFLLLLLLVVFLVLNCDDVCSVFLAGPQLRSCEFSVPHRTSTAICEASVPRRTSTAICVRKTDKNVRQYVCQVEGNRKQCRE